jgi:hypothetical protein
LQVAINSWDVLVTLHGDNAIRSFIDDTQRVRILPHLRKPVIANIRIINSTIVHADKV